MADYYSILEKTIAGLPRNTPEIRQAVYKKARSAIETQLRNMNPAPSEDAINAQLQLLEEAIILIDTENATVEALATPLEPAPQEPVSNEPVSHEPVSETPASPPPEPQPEPEQPPQGVSEPEPVTWQSVEPTPPETPIHRPLVQPEVPTREVTQVPADHPATGAAGVAPVITSSSSAISAEPSAPVVSQPQASVNALSDEVIERAENLANSIPPETVGMDDLGVGTVRGDRGVVVDPSTRDILEPMIAADTLANTATSEAYHSEFEEKKSGGLGGLLKLLVVLGLIGGGGYAIWKNKDVLTELASGFTTDQVANQETAPQPAVVPEPEPVPSPQPEPTPAPAPAPTPAPEPAPEPQPEPVPAPESNEPEIIVPEVIEPVENVEENGDQAQAPTAQPQADAGAAQNGVIPIGEVAYLYEEGTAGSGATRINAAVTWDLRTESIQPGLPAEPVIFGKMDIPDKNMSIDIKINRNVDPAISASHIIEIVFGLPADFSGKGIESIARFVMKETEEAPGEPLVAVPFKASESRFLIALDNLPQALSINTALLRDASWIDIPLVYGTGKRALLTLEKGGTGERVFGEAFRDWQNR